VNMMDYSFQLGRRSRLEAVVRDPFYGRQESRESSSRTARWQTTSRRLLADGRFEIVAPDRIFVGLFPLPRHRRGNRRLIEAINATGRAFLRIPSSTAARPAHGGGKLANHARRHRPPAALITGLV
jgi:hypothetical protein